MRKLRVGPDWGWPRWPSLERYGQDLTQTVRTGGGGPALGREDVLEYLVAVLLRRDCPAAALLGPVGSGRRTCLVALARGITGGGLPVTLGRRQLYLLSTSHLLAGARYQGEVEDRFSKVVAEALAGRDRLIIGLTEPDRLIAALGYGASLLVNLIRAVPAVFLATPGEWEAATQQLAPLGHLVEAISVPIWDEEAATPAVAAHLPALAAHHGVTADLGLAALACRLAARYITGVPLPGSAISLLDLAASFCRSRGDRVLGPSHLLLAVSRRTGLPLGRVGMGPVGDGGDPWLGMEKALGRRVVGQEPALASVASALRRARAALGDPRRPLGSFLFVGPTGVGKTELARTLAEFLFGDEKALVRIDMSEYMERHAVARLIGAPPGYVGFDLPGQLTEPVRRRPFAVVLFDEVEKAHPDVLNLLLQVLEDGRLTDGHGRTVDFRHTVIILTSNVGSVAARAQGGWPRERWLEAAWQHFRPELLNRLDEVIAFAPLTPEDVERIAAIQLERLARRLEPWAVRLRLTPAALTALARAGYSPELGARPLRRLIDREVVDPLVRALLAGEIPPGTEVVVDWASGAWRREVRRPAEEGRDGIPNEEVFSWRGKPHR